MKPYELKCHVKKPKGVFNNYEELTFSVSEMYGSDFSRSL